MTWEAEEKDRDPRSILGVCSHLKNGDVIEVLKDFDSGVVGLGDRAIYLEGMRRVIFRTRIPSSGIVPVYDVWEGMFDEGWVGIVDHIDDPPELGELDKPHPVLRLDRRERYLATSEKFRSNVRRVWGLDFRYAENKAKFDDLIVEILQAEPDLSLLNIHGHFFRASLRHLERPPRRAWGPSKLYDSTWNALGVSERRLVESGRVVKNGCLYRAREG